VPDFVSVLEYVVLSGNAGGKSCVGRRDASASSRPALAVTLDQLNAAGSSGRAAIWSVTKQLKQLSRHARAIVRTGECQPYTNIVAGRPAWYVLIEALRPIPR
jgi:D-ribose pyranase